LQEGDNLFKELHLFMNFFLSRLNLQQRRWYVALESKRIGRGGDSLVSKITGVCAASISHGRKELNQLLTENFIIHPRPVGGRPATEKKYPNIRIVLEQLLSDEIAGEPMSEQRWVRSSTRKLAARLNEAGYRIGCNTVCRLLKDIGFSLKANKKKFKPTSYGPEREEQFNYIAAQKKTFISDGLPTISVDTKKKEWIGNFKRSGRSWCKNAEEVLKYDFTSLADCRAVPYGIYDLIQNRGYVFVGTSGDTPEFAIDVIARWWKQEGLTLYPSADHLLILADGGGSNGYRVRAWKKQIHEKLSDCLRLSVTVCHYPPGCSKWNPVEYRLFSQISINWEGKPLKSLALMLGYIRGTSTRKGLKVKSYLHKGSYQQGQKVTKAEMEQLNLQSHTVCPDWNYTIRPRLAVC
jgi:hypothetical protein